MTKTIRLVKGEHDERPEIKIGPDLDRMVREAVAALAQDPEVYQRGGMLVHVVNVTTAPTTSKAAPYTPTIRVLPLSLLRVRLSACARWMRYEQRSETWKRTGVPDNVVAGVLGLGSWDDVRPLIACITAPTIRPNGSVLEASGYDVDTALLHWPSSSFIGVIDDAGITHAREAAATLFDLVCDFPFATPADRSAWLASVLSIIGRHAVDGPVPMFVVKGTTRGTGKSRLVDVAVRLACGHDAARTSLSSNDDEQRKQVTSLLLIGDPVILVDNVASNRKLGGAALDGVLTSTTWKERDLGKTSTLSLPARAVWFATGNNLQYAGDLTRRSLQISLVAHVERPEDRTGFKYPDLLDHVSAQRHILVACVLTILRAHANANRPACGKLWGSFESWSRVIAGAIRWMGYADPLDAAATEDDANDEEALFVAQTIAGLDEITRSRTDGCALTRDVLEALYPHGEATPLASKSLAAMRDAVEAATGGDRPNVLRLSKWLRRIAGRIVAGRRVLAALDAHTKTQTWRVEVVPEPTTGVRRREGESVEVES